MEFFLPMLGLGLVTGFHCIAMCGALVATYAVKDSSEGTFTQRLTPHMIYQGAKITSYVVVGMILGAIGAAFDLAGIRGWVMLAAGLFMVMLGLNMTGHFPFFRKLTLKPPKALVRAISRNRKKAKSEAAAGRISYATPLVFGLLTGLMPCGPLQAAQLSAAGTGSAAAGAAAMLGFGLGTAPLMLAMGVGSGYIGEVLKKRMTVVAAVAVIILGLVMFNRGSMLVGSPLTSQTIAHAVIGDSDEVAEFSEAEDGVAEVAIIIENTRFIPDAVQIPADRPVRLVVERREDTGCSDQLAVPQAGVLADLEPYAITVVELPPIGEGAYTLTCGMGMMSGRIISGTASTGIAGNPALGIVLGIVVIGGIAYAIRKRPGTATETCSAPAADRTAAASTKIMGFAPTEFVLIAGAIAAAVIAGLLVGGSL